MAKRGISGVDISEYHCPYCGMYINLKKAIERVDRENRYGEIKCPYCNKKIAKLS